MSSIIYSAEALDDLRNIFSYISAGSGFSEYAEKQITRITKSIRSLEVFPLKHPSVDFEPWRSAGMRVMPIDRYVVFYIADADSQTVSIYRIIYGGMDLPVELGKM